MTTKGFPTPAEMRAQQEVDAEAEVAAALGLVERELRAGRSTVSHRWDDAVRRVVTQRLAASGWHAEFHDDQREGQSVTVKAMSGSRESYPPRG